MKLLIRKEVILTYKTKIVPVKCSKTDYNYLMNCNKLSADVWNYCVKIDKKHYDKFGAFMNMSDMQKSIKGIVPLHAKGIGHVFRKYQTAKIAAFKSIKAKHENSNKVELPYKLKKFYNTGWDYQSIGFVYDKGIIKLARKMVINNQGKRTSNPVKCYVKEIPQNIVEIELVYRNGLYLVVKYKEDDVQQLIQSDNVAAIDLGEIHSITSIDNNGNAIIITGRKMRSIKRLRNKEQAKLRSKMSKCTKYSKRYKKYNHALWNLKYKSERQILDCIHKISKLYLDYCLDNCIKTVYYGKLDSCTRNTKERTGKFIGQKLNEWNFGELTKQLHNKLERYGIDLIDVSEAYTSQTCPNCSSRHKPKDRNYICKCGYTQHRDLVGAINILNFNINSNIKQYNNKKYLRIE